MEGQTARVDLHLHSSESDGTLTPAALVWAAIAGRLDIIALTDHDTTAGVPDAAAAAAGSLRVISGVEISSTWGGADLHVLGYGIDPGHPLLLRYSEAAVARRDERMRAMVERLRELGIRVGYEDVRATDTAATLLGRPHLARTLLRLGHVRSIGEAFERFLSDHGPAFLPTQLIGPREAIDLIHAAGGLAVWAHPPLVTFDQEIRRFADWGLNGVECFRPRTPPAESLLLQQAAVELGLLVTGGSDWHGKWHGSLGEFALAAGDVSGFLSALGYDGVTAPGGPPP